MLQKPIATTHLAHAIRGIFTPAYVALRLRASCALRKRRGCTDEEPDARPQADEKSHTVRRFCATIPPEGRNPEAEYPPRILRNWGAWSVPHGRVIF